MAVIIDGKAIAEKIRGAAREKAASLKKRGITPCLAVVLAGADPASVSYVTGKEKALADAGMAGRDIRLPASVSEEELLSIVAELNSDPLVHGILVQLPLPLHIDENKIIETIAPEKDVDGFHPVSAGKLLLGRPAFLPCTPHGIIRLLSEMKIRTSGVHAVIVGRSNIVGKPLSLLLSRRNVNATVTLCHTGTPDLSVYTKEADILVAAAGKPGLITGDMVKPGAAVIDVGVNRISDPSKKSGFRLSGDADFKSVAETAGWITPVPGGVGPMTIAMLIENVAAAAENAARK